MPDLTVTLTAGQATRISHAVGVVRSLKDGNGDARDATLAEVKTEVIGYLKGFVGDVYKREQVDAVPPDTDFDPT